MIFNQYKTKAFFAAIVLSFLLLPISATAVEDAKETDDLSTKFPGFPRLYNAPLQAQELPKTTFYLGFGATNVVYPPIPFSPTVIAGGQGFCSSGKFCNDRKLSWANVDLSVISNLSLRLQFDGPSFQMTPAIRISFGHGLYWKDRSLRLANNFELTAFRFSIRNGFIAKQYVQAQCNLGFTGPGYKHVDYDSAVPFEGLSVLGMQQSCQMAIGSSRVQFLIGHFFTTGLQIGQSGRGEPNRQGSFGALNSESIIGVTAGMVARLPEKARKLGIHGVSVMGNFTGQAYLNRGCLAIDNNGMFACGNNMITKDIRVGVIVSLLIKSP